MLSYIEGVSQSKCESMYVSDNVLFFRNYILHRFQEFHNSNYNNNINSNNNVTYSRVPIVTNTTCYLQ